MSATDKTARPARPTPENTPVPGGGSWRWTPDGWAPNAPPDAPTVTAPAQPTAAPNLE